MEAAGTDRIVKRIELKAPIARVWRALTDHKQFGAWFQVDLEGPFVPEQSTQGKITYPGCDHLMMKVVVKKMESPRLFSFEWRPTAADPAADNPEEPPTLVEFKLEPTGDGTRLTLTESGFDGLSDAQREQCFRRNDQGWTGQMKSIETYVKNNP